MKRIKRRRKCRHCRELFVPDPRNADKQKHCSKPACRKASRAASQAKWLKGEKGRDYFRGPENVQRVQEWREANPGYSRRNKEKGKDALQDLLKEKPSQKQIVVESLPRNALQDLLIEQLPVIVGLIANLTDSALQDDIVATTRRLQQLGADILNPFPHNRSGGDYDRQTTYRSPQDPPSSSTIQLGGRPSGP